MRSLASMTCTGDLIGGDTLAGGGAAEAGVARHKARQTGERKRQWALPAHNTPPPPPPPATWSRSHERTVGLCASSHEGTRGHAAASLGTLGTASARASARCPTRRGHTDYAQASPRNSITVSGKLRSRKRAMALAPNCQPTPHPHTT